MSQGPIFIGGLDRSGKTPLRLMLSSHPNIAMTRRTNMWTRYYGRYGNLGDSANFERCLTALLQSKHVRVLEPDPDRIRREFRQGRPTYARLFGLVQEHFAERMGKPRWGDQLAFIESYADPIFAAFPDAKMIHMIRDPRDRYADSATAGPHRRGKVGWDTARWLYSTGLAKRNRRRYPEQYKIAQYETLISRPEETLREVCAFLNEEFSPGMLTMENAIRFGESSPNRASELPPDAGSRTPDSQKVMSGCEIAFMQIKAGDVMSAWGYRPKPVDLTFTDHLMFRLVDGPANSAGMLAWRVWGVRRLDKS
jgi:hypothetical protein